MCLSNVNLKKICFKALYSDEFSTQVLRVTSLLCTNYFKTVSSSVKWVDEDDDNGDDVVTDMY